MRKSIALLSGGLVALFIIFSTHALAITEEEDLKFNPGKNRQEKTLEFPDGNIVKYRAYENIYYVKNVVDSTYQYLNIYIPEAAYRNKVRTPIFLKTNVGGYMAAKAAAPSLRDITGRALAEGYVVVIPGSRGSNSTVSTATGEIYTGKAPAGILDLKAAIRYLRHNRASLPGDPERIITDGTSAGGAMSALLGATGNHPLYEPYLQEMGAADERDDIFAAICFCPITDLEHADMGYEWLYNVTNNTSRGLSSEQTEISNELAALYPDYLNNLGLKMPDGTPLTTSNYKEYLKSFLLKSAYKASQAGTLIEESTGIKPQEGIVDLNTYLNYVVNTKPLKIPPAFDPMDVLISRSSPENSVFGDTDGTPKNFTDFSLQKATDDPAATIEPELKKRVFLMNPMNFIGDPAAQTSPNWYIRHGAVDRDTGFQVPVNLYTKLVNNGYNVDFNLAWGKGHTGDYDPDEVFEWIKTITDPDYINELFLD